MNSKIRRLRPFIILFFLLLGIGLFIYVTGLIDYIPRLRASAQSPNGELTVRVYQKRLFPRPIFPQMGAVARVYDKNDRLIYEKIIYHDDDWSDTVGMAYNEISFDGDEIRIGPGAYDSNKVFVIRKSDLK